MKSVGIHLDSRKIRIVELTIASKSLSLQNIFEMERSPGDSVSDILKSYFAGAGARPDRVVASVGNVPVVVRRFALPFRDRTRVQQAIRSEFEDTLPVDMDNYILEFQPLGREGNLNTFIGALISREPLEDMNRVFENIDVLPSDFLIPAEALGRMGLTFLANEFAPSSTVCFCDIGFDATQISVVRFPREAKKFKASAYADSMIEFRHISRGSKDIYDREGNRMAMSVREFEEWLATRVSFADGSTGLDNLKNAVRPLLVELYQVTQAAVSKSGFKIDSYVITGAMSQCAGFRDFFEKELRTPTLVWDPFQSVSSPKAPIDGTAAARFVIPLALALRHGAFRTLPWLNFRRSSRRKQIISAALDQLALPEFKSAILPVAAMSVALFIICMIASVLMDARLEKQADRTSTALSRAKTALGSKKDRLISDPDEVADEFKAYRVKKMAALPSNRASAPYIDDLLKISQALPSNVRVDELKIVSRGDAKELEASIDASQNTGFSNAGFKESLQSKGYSAVSVAPNGRNVLVKAKGK